MESPAPDSSQVESLERIEAIVPAIPAAGSPFWISVLLLVIFSFLIMVEFVSSYGFHRVSKVQRRIREEYLSVLRMRQTHDRGRTQVLLAGNSLLLAAVDLPLLKEILPTDIEVKRFAVEQTTYFDWLYGLRRVFREGAHPDILVLALTVRQLVMSEVLGEYFAYNLMSAGDLPAVARDLDLDRTSTSNLLFGHVSAFYAGRADIRKWLLAKIFPGVHDLMDLMTQTAPKPLGEADFQSLMPRLTALKRTAAEYDVRLIFLAPPLTHEAYVDVLTAAGAAAGVPVIIALPPESIGRKDFGPDGFHMNDSGATRYTNALAPRLQASVESFYATRIMAN